MKKKEVKEIKKVEVKSEKEKKKRIINLSIIIASIVVVVAGLITGLVFLLTSKSPERNPEMDKFTESVNNSNQSTTDIKSEGVILPTDTEIGDIKYIDAKYIVATTDGVESIYIRNESVGAPSKIVSFAKENEQISYTKVEEIVEDSALVTDEETNKTYAVDLINKEVVVETTEYVKVEFKNGFVVLSNWNDESSKNVYKIINVYNIKTKVSVLNFDISAKIINYKLFENIAYFQTSNGALIYSYEIKSNSLTLINSFNNSNLTTERVIIDTEKFLLVEYKTETIEYVKANIRSEDKYYVVEYVKIDKVTGTRTFIDFECLITKADFNILNNYYGLQTSGFMYFNHLGEGIGSDVSHMYIVLDENLNKIFSYNKNKFGDIVYFDGEVFVTSGTTSNIMDVNGNEVELFDKNKYRVTTSNVWNDCFLIDGVDGVGITNTRGEVIASNNFEKISPIIDGYAIGYYNGHFYRLDVSNKKGTLINNYASNYDAFAFMGIGFYVIEDSSSYSILNMKNEVLYSNVLEIKTLDLNLNNIQLLIKTNDKNVSLNSYVINESIASLYYYGGYVNKYVDISLESFDEIDLNISSLESYKKIIKAQPENQSQTALPSATEDYGSSSKVYSFQTYDTSNWTLGNEYLAGTMGGGYAHGHEFSYVKNNANLWFYNTDENNNDINDSLEQVLPKMENWSTGKVDQSCLYRNEDGFNYEYEFSGSTNFKGQTIYGGTYVKLVSIETIGDVGMIVWSLLEHISINTSSKEEGGCDDKYTITTTTMRKFYSLYYAVYFSSGVTINELSYTANDETIMSLNKMYARENLHNYLDNSSILVKDDHGDKSSGVIVDNSNDGTWGAPSIVEESWKQETIRNGNIYLPNGAILVGSTFGNSAEFKLLRPYKEQSDNCGFYSVYGTANKLYGWTYDYNGSKNGSYHHLIHYETWTNKDSSNASGDEPSSNDWSYSSGDGYSTKKMGIKITFGLTPSSAQFTLAISGSSITETVDSNANGNYLGSGQSVKTSLFTINYETMVNNNYKVTITAIPGYAITGFKFKLLHDKTYNFSRSIDDYKELDTNTNSYTFTISKSRTIDDYWGDYYCSNVYDLVVTVKPIQNSITYYKKIQNHIELGLDEYVGEGVKIYYGTPLINNIDKITSCIAGSDVNGEYQSSFYGLCYDYLGEIFTYFGKEFIINSASYDYIFSGNTYFDPVSSGTYVYSYISGWDENGDDIDDKFSYYNSASSENKDFTSYVGSPGSGGYVFLKKMFQENTAKNYTAYIYVEPANYDVRLYLGDLDTQANTVWASGDNGSSWVELDESDYISDKTTDGWEYITFNQYYGETLEHAIKRSYADKKESTSGTDSDFVNMLAECSSFPKFLTPLQYTKSNMSAVGNVDNIKNTDYYCSVTDSYDCTYQLTNKNKKVVNIGDYYIIFNWEDRKFDVNFISNHETYSLTGANVISSTDSNSTVKVETKNLSQVSIGEGSAARDIPLVYGYTGNNDVYDSVNKFKGWYLKSDKNTADEYRVFDSTISSAVIPLSINSHWLDSDFDGTIDLYAHYETVDDTKFLFDIKYFDENNNEISTSNLGNYYNSSDFSIKGGTENLTISNSVFYNKQNNTITIKIKPNSKTSLGSVGLDLYSCKNRKDADYSRFYTTQTLNWNNYTDKVYETYTGMQYKYDKALGISYNNSDNKVKVTYSNGEYTIEIKTTIGSISSKVNGTKSMMYYGGAISLKFVDKLYDGNIEMTANSTEYNAINSNYIDLDFINNFKDYYSLPYLRKYNSV